MLGGPFPGTIGATVRLVTSAAGEPPTGASVNQSPSDGPATGPLPRLPLLSVAPVVAFLVVNRLAGLRWAVVTATVLSIVLVIDRRRKGLALGKFMPIVTLAVLARGVIGVITDSEDVYFGLGIATKYVVGAVLLGSVVLRRPLAAKAAPYLLDVSPRDQHHSEYLKTMRDITLIVGAYYLLSASFDVWLFQRSSIEGFVLLRFLASWPLTAAALLAVFGVANTRFSRIPGLAPLSELIEGRTSALLGSNNANHSA